MSAVMDLTPENYHGDFTRDSNSSLRDFEDSIEYYAAVRVHQTMEPREPTAAMDQGNFADLYVFQPDKFERTVLMAPPEITRRHKAFSTLETANPGKTIITSPEMQVIIGIRDGIMRNTTARQIVEAEGDVQKIITWDCPETGCPLKLMEDKTTKTGLMANMKVTDDVDPDSWARKVLNFKYHCQAALYLDGAWQAAQIDGPLVWVVVSRKPPHECAVYTPDDAALALGVRCNCKTIQELMDRRKRNDWRGRWTDSIQTLSLPAWATR